MKHRLEVIKVVDSYEYPPNGKLLAIHINAIRMKVDKLDSDQMRTIVLDKVPVVVYLGVVLVLLWNCEVSLVVLNLANDVL